MTHSIEDMKALHGPEYVAKFEQNQSKHRLGRLTDQLSLGAEEQVLDIGCGNALLMPLVADKVKVYVGVDFSPDFIKKAQAKARALSISNARFECRDIIDFCHSNPSSFHSAFAMDISEHVAEDDWLEILKAVFIALVPGGKLYLHTPNASFFLEIMKEHNFLIKQFPEHIAVRNMTDNIRLTEAAGFKVADKKFLPHYNILKHLHLFSHIPLIGKLFNARIFITAQKPEAI